MEHELVPADYGQMNLRTAEEFDRKVKECFAAAFPAVARQIIETCDTSAGICIEVGSGTALLSIELARQSAMTVYCLEKAPAMFHVGIRNIQKAGLMARIRPVAGDAHEIPFDDGFADLVVSRGSFHFWEDQARVLEEILRVLKKNGTGFVGGGFGHGHSPADLRRMTDLRDRSLGNGADCYRSPHKMEQALAAAGVKAYRLFHDETGLWVLFRKRIHKGTIPRSSTLPKGEPL